MMLQPCLCEAVAGDAFTQDFFVERPGLNKSCFKWACPEQVWPEQKRRLARWQWRVDAHGLLQVDNIVFGLGLRDQSVLSRCSFIFALLICPDPPVLERRPTKNVCRDDIHDRSCLPRPSKCLFSCTFCESVVLHLSVCSQAVVVQLGLLSCGSPTST